MTLQPSTSKKATNSSSWQARNTDLDLLVIGLLSKDFIMYLMLLIYRGPYLLGIKAVIAQSFERIHRSNLLGMGIMPLQFKADESSQTLGLSGSETFTINFTEEDLKVGAEVLVEASNGTKFTCRMRLDTEPEIAYYKNGGILPYVLRKLLTA